MMPEVTVGKSAVADAGISASVVVLASAGVPTADLITISFAVCRSDLSAADRRSDVRTFNSASRAMRICCSTRRLGSPARSKRPRMSSVAVIVGSTSAAKHCRRLAPSMNSQYVAFVSNASGCPQHRKVRTRDCMGLIVASANLAPISGFCPSTRTFAIRFFQTPPRGGALAFSLALHLHQVGRGTCTPKLLSMPSTQLSRWAAEWRTSRSPDRRRLVRWPACSAA